LKGETGEESFRDEGPELGEGRFLLGFRTQLKLKTPINMQTTEAISGGCPPFFLSVSTAQSDRQKFKESASREVRVGGVDVCEISPGYHQGVGAKNKGVVLFR
jgi:hypothetical protein